MVREEGKGKRGGETMEGEEKRPKRRSINLA
jgi:hypothetical protein